MNNELYNKAIGEVNVNTDKLKNEAISLDKELKELLKRQNELAASGEKNTKAYQDIAVQVRIAKDTIKETTAQIDGNVKALNLSKGSLDQNKALLKSLQDQYTALSQKQGDNSKELIQLNTLVQGVSQSIERQEEKVNKSREVFDLHKGSIDAIKGSFDDIKSVSGDFGPSLEEAAKGFTYMQKGLTAVKTGFTSVGGAIKTTGFGLLLLVLESLVQYFTKNADGIKIFRGLISGLGKAIDMVKNAFGNLGEKMVNAVTHPIDSLQKLGNIIKENLLNRFKAIGVILDGIVHMDFKKAFNGAVQWVTGITNATDKAAKAFTTIKKKAIEAKNEIKKAYEEGKKHTEKPAENTDTGTKKVVNLHQTRINQIKETVNVTNEAHDELIASQARMSQTVLQGYAKEIADTETHFKQLKQKYQNNKDTVEQLKREEAAAIASINKKFRDEDAVKLNEYHSQLSQMALNYTADAKQKELTALEEETTDKLAKLDKATFGILNHIQTQQTLINTLNIQGNTEQALIEQKTLDEEMKRLESSGKIRLAILQEQKKKEDDINQKSIQDTEDKKEAPLQKGINNARESGHESSALQQELVLLDMQHQFKLERERHTEQELLKINQEYAKKKAEIEEKLTTSRIHAGDKYIDAVLKNTKKDSAIYKAAFVAKKATAIADVIMSTKKSIIASFEGYSSMPFIGQALAIAQGAFIATQGAMSIAEIAKQKPGFAQGGQYTSDGRGALLSGYSRTDNTNAYLRSGEAVVVSEAMRNPWARNLVSAINVAYGGRDFSATNPGYGYAIGGIFTDGGNANRYYSQPINDQKDLANTLAYQMINNFPPIYVDVKDVNNQQNILAQTVNRVNL
ncbi:hypothetical protein KHS38_09680 [Mucilaginibacter sp. Bleaf8]|uniref:hypothetical protein n=1 Tax=Mucilaginibacter sp. Bleaf8 TaxID=2834430 RepID=UPI001BD026CE|nr:hypothetical protein [Mucilaginibacter sp. Bleaf8]MBS7564673.1 hypothetical protein [Mucilaginibacter sp. Bleaf8]